jgi:hypothetical protein
MPLDLSTGRKIRFSEIQYEGIGFTLIDIICQIKRDKKLSIYVTQKKLLMVFGNLVIF